MPPTGGLFESPLRHRTSVRSTSGPGSCDGGSLAAQPVIAIAAPATIMRAPATW